MFNTKLKSRAPSSARLQYIERPSPAMTSKRTACFHILHIPTPPCNYSSEHWCTSTSSALGAGQMSQQRTFAFKVFSSWACSFPQTCQLTSVLHHCKDSFGLLQLNVSAYRGQKGNTERINEDQALSKSQKACTQWLWCSDFKLVPSIQKSLNKPYFLQNTSAYWNMYISSVICIFI